MMRELKADTVYRVQTALVGKSVGGGKKNQLPLQLGTLDINRTLIKKTLQCCLYRVSFQRKDTLSALQKKPLAITKEKLSVMELRVVNNKGDANIA